MAENESRLEGLPPSQGGKYVGFGSSPRPTPQSDSQGDVFSAVTQVRDGGYDYNLNETVNVVTAKTTEIGQMTWGIMRGVMAMASQKVEEYTKEGSPSWKTHDWPKNETHSNCGNDASASSSSRNVDSSSWDDWDNDGYRKHASDASHNGDSWAGWDDDKDDGGFYQTPSRDKSSSDTGKSDGNWSGGGFD